MDRRKSENLVVDAFESTLNVVHWHTTQCQVAIIHVAIVGRPDIVDVTFVFEGCKRSRIYLGKKTSARHSNGQVGLSVLELR